MPNDRKHVLIVDDEEGIRESFKLILGSHYDLAFAVHAADAMQKIEADGPDLVLLDIKMPKMNGLDFLKEIKKVRPSLPVIIVTGYQSVEMAQEAVRNGASDYIPKPFDSAHILDAVKKTLS
jgi:DNA-binding NtrC family response regulator